MLCQGLLLKNLVKVKWEWATFFLVVVLRISKCNFSLRLTGRVRIFEYIANSNCCLILFAIFLYKLFVFFFFFLIRIKGKIWLCRMVRTFPWLHCTTWPLVLAFPRSTAAVGKSVTCTDRIRNICVATLGVWVNWGQEPYGRASGTEINQPCKFWWASVSRFCLLALHPLLKPVLKNMCHGIRPVALTSNGVEAGSWTHYPPRWLSG